MRSRMLRTVAGLACLLTIGLLSARAEDKPDSPPATLPSTRPVKPLSEQVNKGLAFLVKIQLPSGAWAQGDESAAMGNSLNEQIKSSPNVADTCMAVMALVRGGSTPAHGPYQQQVAKAVGFVCEQIEAADDKDLFITSLRGTRTQMKLGSCIDTFMAAQMLAELKDQMPDPVSKKRVDDALAKVIKKIEINQKNDGRWAADGWAPILAQAQATKALNVAAQRGVIVSRNVIHNAEQVAENDFKNMGAVATDGSGAGGATFAGGSLTFSSTAGDAGVELYARSAQIASMQANNSTNQGERKDLEKVANSATTQPQVREDARKQLAFMDANDKELKNAQAAVIDRFNDKNFVAGFGSNGGEEFLSYLNVGESLYQKGGDDWAKWDKSMTENLNRIQNDDGSWAGQHCITGRTFCSAAAIMVLTIDRAPAGPTTQKTAEH